MRNHRAPVLGEHVTTVRTRVVADKKLAKMRAGDDGGSRLKVPTLGLDVPLGELPMVGGNFTPPGFKSAYKVRKSGRRPG